MTELFYSEKVYDEEINARRLVREHNCVVLNSKMRDVSRWSSSTNFQMSFETEKAFYGQIFGGGDIKKIIGIRLEKVFMPNTFTTIKNVGGGRSDGFQQSEFYLSIKEFNGNLKGPPISGNAFALLSVDPRSESSFFQALIDIYGGTKEFPSSSPLAPQSLTMKLTDYAGNIIDFGTKTDAPMYDGHFITSIMPGNITTVIQTETAHNLNVGDRITVFTRLVNAVFTKEARNKSFEVVGLTNATTFEIDLASEDSNTYTFPGTLEPGYLIVDKYQISYVFTLIDAESA